MVRAKDLVEYSKSLSILYVEDDDGIRESTTNVFQNFFKNVTIAIDGLKGLEEFEKEKFDIVVTDIRMPHMDGISMIKKIKEINEEQIIIVTSAHDDSSYLMELIDLGVDGFILKPLELEKLLRVFYKTCRVIVERKTLEAYRKTLEELEANRMCENDGDENVEF